MALAAVAAVGRARTRERARGSGAPKARGRRSPPRPPLSPPARSPRAPHLSPSLRSPSSFLSPAPRPPAPGPLPPPVSRFPFLLFLLPSLPPSLAHPPTPHAQFREMSSLRGRVFAGRSAPSGPGPRSPGLGGAPAVAGGKASGRPSPGGGLGGPGAGLRPERSAGPGVRAAATPASCPLAVLLPRAPGRSPSRCGTRCQVARALVPRSVLRSHYPRFSVCVSRFLPFSDPCSLPHWSLSLELFLSPAFSREKPLEGA